jgi:hypothetical protein
MPPFAPGTMAVRNTFELMQAIQSAPAGTTLELADGTYSYYEDPAQNHIPMPYAVLLASRHIHFRAQTAGAAVIDGQDRTRLLAVAPATNVTLEGLVLTRGYADESAAPTSGRRMSAGPDATPADNDSDEPTPAPAPPATGVLRLFARAHATLTSCTIRRTKTAAGANVVYGGLMGLDSYAQPPTWLITHVPSRSTQNTCLCD